MKYDPLILQAFRHIFFFRIGDVDGALDDDDASALFVETVVDAGGAGDENLSLYMDSNSAHSRVVGQQQHN